MAMVAVEKIEIAGFKSIGRAEVDLRPVNVLIGANGSGKSNFMEVFSLLRAVRAGRLEDYVARAGGADRVLHYGAGVTGELRVDVGFGGDGGGYGVLLKAGDGDRLYVSDEWGAGGEGVGVDAGDQIGGWRVYRFHDAGANSPLRKSGDLHDNRYLRGDGSNLAAFLYFLREKHSWSYGFIRRTVQLVAPFFDDFYLEPLALNRDKIRLEWRHRGMEGCFDASSLSDGTLRFIALAALFLQPKEWRPSVVLLDGPELGLNPYAITLVESLVCSAAVDTQVIMATQSPCLLDHFGPEDVVVADRVKGGTGFRRLDPERLDVWLERYSLGELWEKNELGGRPAGSYHERPSHD